MKSMISPRSSRNAAPPKDLGTLVGFFHIFIGRPPTSQSLTHPTPLNSCCVKIRQDHGSSYHLWHCTRFWFWFSRTLTVAAHRPSTVNVFCRSFRSLAFFPQPRTPTGTQLMCFWINKNRFPEWLPDSYKMMPNVLHRA